MRKKEHATLARPDSVAPLAPVHLARAVAFPTAALALGLLAACRRAPPPIHADPPREEASAPIVAPPKKEASQASAGAMADGPDVALVTIAETPTSPLAPKPKTKPKVTPYVPPHVTPPPIPGTMMPHHLPADPPIPMCSGPGCP